MKVFTGEQQDRLGVDEEGRPAWDRLVGKPGSSVKAAIEAYNPELEVIETPEDAMVTMDFRVDRVRVYVDGNGVVIRPPAKG
jgi:DNA-directed RNA polymerase alpha subunit